MSDVIVFDTETTGIPAWKEPSDSVHQPHIFELAGVRASESGAVLEEFHTLIKPEGWIIPTDIAELTGITTEMAGDLGISEKMAVESFLDFWGGRLRIAHNTTFDNRMIRIATKRFLGEHQQECWHQGPYECTLKLSRPFVKRRHGAMPTLGQAYEFFTGRPMVGAHRAFTDTMACLEVYFAIQRLETVA